MNAFCGVDRLQHAALIRIRQSALLTLADRIRQPLRNADKDLVAALAAINAGLDLGIALGGEHRGLDALTGGPATTFAALLGAGYGKC